MEQRIIYIGLDVHKDTIAVALAGRARRGSMRGYGKIANTPALVRSGGEAGESWLAPFDFAMRPALAVTAFSASW